MAILDGKCDDDDGISKNLTRWRWYLAVHTLRDGIFQATRDCDGTGQIYLTEKK